MVRSASPEVSTSGDEAKSACQSATDSALNLVVKALGSVGTLLITIMIERQSWAPQVRENGP